MCFSFVLFPVVKGAGDRIRKKVGKKEKKLKRREKDEEIGLTQCSCLS
jgi:hypothetical protein